MMAESAGEGSGGGAVGGEDVGAGPKGSGAGGSGFAGPTGGGGGGIGAGIGQGSGISERAFADDEFAVRAGGQEGKGSAQPAGGSTAAPAEPAPGEGEDEFALSKKGGGS